MTTYVGIDFSLNSPAFCIHKDQKFIWGSLTRTDRTPESLRKTKDKPYFILHDHSDFDLFFLEKREMPDDYLEKERVKIDYFLEAVDLLWSHIEPHLGKETKIAMEGLSFMSAGNSLIDISMATALIRKKIIDKVGSENFYVFSPTAIKKFAGKGNLKKDGMYNSLVENFSSIDNMNTFTSLLEDNRGSWITKSLQINKPIDDIVDATFVCLLLRDFDTKKDI